MAQNEMETGAAGPRSFDDLNRSVDDLLPLIEAEADAAEQSYHLTDRVGGAELSFVEAMQLVERVSRADGSTGWCMMVQGVMGASAGAFLSDEGAGTVYPDDANVTVAGQGVPRGYAQPVDGGYLIKGLWGYGSSIYHAEWIHSGCFITDGTDVKLDAAGHPEIVLVHHPRDTIELKGNWDVLGLRGTGSYDYTVKGDELFVPASTCFLFDNPAQARGGIQYGSGLVGLTTWGHTGWALGEGRRTLDELAALARERADVFGKLGERAAFKQSFAEAEAKYRAARAFVYSAWGDLCDGFDRGTPASAEQIALIRLAMRHLHDTISEISTFAHRATRGASLRQSVLQRCYRDIHSGTQHILLADEITQDCGQVLLGMAGDDAAWNVLGLLH